MDDAGKVVGLKNSHKLMEDIPNKIRSTMGIIADVSLHGTIGDEYIEIDVHPYPVAISYKGVFYRRSGATNQRLTSTELESFMLRRRGANWESSPLPGLTLGDIEDNEIDYFLDKALEKGRIHEGAANESKEELVDKLHLIKSGYLTNAAALLFTKDPERWFTGAFIKVGYFETDADIIYHDEVRGSLLKQVDKAMELIYFKYLKAKISYQGVQRIEKYPFPDSAIREALLNSVIHKQYESGIPIQISVYDDRLYIANIGRIPEDWTLDNLLGKHASRPYNPNIANVFYLAGSIESWGRGIEKIFNACKEDGVPEPSYTVHPGDIMIKFTAPEDRVIRSESRFEKANGDDGVVNGTLSENEVLDEVVNEAVNEVDDVVNEVDTRRARIIALLKEKQGITIKQLAENIGVAKATIERDLSRLKELNKIRRVGSDKTGHWEIVE
jgi:ATP-dependent DNA helicase RecG